MANGGRYPMGTGWQSGVQTRQSLGITYRYSSYLPGGAGRRGYGVGGRSLARGSVPAASFGSAGGRPTRVRIPGGRSR